MVAVLLATSSEKNPNVFSKSEDTVRRAKPTLFTMSVSIVDDCFYPSRNGKKECKETKAPKVVRDDDD